MAPAGAITKSRIFQIMAKRPEIFCFIVAVVFTYLAKNAKSNRQRTVYQSQPPPKHFFSPTSVVLDFPYGNLDDVSELLEDEEVLFVMFYAPWCGNSVKTRPEFEKAARYLRHEIQFVAINCWYVDGQCRGKNSFMSFPVFYFYQFGLNGYKYTGLHTAEYISSFVLKLLNPLTLLSSDQQLVLFLSQADNSMVGYFDFRLSSLPASFQQFYYAAMRVHEKDHKNPIQFGVIADERLARAFGMSESPCLYYHRILNDTLKFPSNYSIYASTLTTWVFNHRQKPWVKWLLPSGVKSLSISSELERGAALVSFIPDTPLANVNQYFDMLREVATSYNNCDNDKKWVDVMETSQFSRWKKLSSYLDTLDSCLTFKPKVAKQEPKEVPLKHTKLPPKKCCFSVSLGNQSESPPCVACINYEPDSQSASQGCGVLSLQDILPSWTTGSTLLSQVPVFLRKYFKVDLCTEWKPTYNPKEHMTMCCHNNSNSAAEHLRYQGYQHIPSRYSWDKLHHFKNTDPFVAESLERDQTRLCEKVTTQRAHNWLAYMEVASLGFDTTELHANISGAGCSNNSLHFYAVSSKEALPLAASLGVLDEVKGNTTHQGSLTLIVDLQNEVQYRMAENFSKQNIAYFIQNYTAQSLPRYLRSHQQEVAQKRCHSIPSRVCINTVTTQTFNEVVMDTDKDVVLLYYSPSCGFCSTFSHVYLSLARYFTSAKNLVFARINGDENDLAWRFTVESYPTIIIYPAHNKAESVVFPENLQKTLPNLVWFLLRYTTHKHKLETSLNICSKSCINSNMDASSQRVLDLNHEVIALQRKIRSMQGHVTDVTSRLTLNEPHPAADTNNSKNNSWWLSLLKRYTYLLKCTRNRKFLQKKNLRLLHSILKDVAMGSGLEQRRLATILKEYERQQSHLVRMLKSRHSDIDQHFLQDLKEINEILDLERTGNG